MNAKAIACVFAKECREMLRDRRVVFGAFVAPVFLIIVFMALIGFVDRQVTKRPDIRVATIGTVDNPVLDAFRKQGAIKVLTAPDRQEALKLVRSGEARLLLEFAPDFTAKLERGGAKVTATYDESETMSAVAVAALRAAISKVNDATIGVLLRRNGLPPEMAEPIAFEQKPLDKKRGLAGSSIVGLLPYLIVLWAFYGGMSIVSDLIAGEKERGTMETLLVSPARRSELATGKFLALAVVCLASSLSSLLGVVLVGALRVPATQELFPSGFSLSAGSIAAIAAVLLPLVLMFAGLLTAVSAAARNIRESQTYLTLVSFIVLMPAIFSQFIGFTGASRSAWARVTPVLNAAMSMRESLLDKADWGAVAVCAVSTLLLAAVAFRVTVWLFNREQILTRV